MKKTIYETIASRHNSRLLSGRVMPENAPNIYPTSWKEADIIICHEIVYYGMRIAMQHVDIVNLPNISYKLWYEVFRKEDIYHNVQPNKERHVKNLLKKIHDFRQRNWFYEPFDIPMDYDVYKRMGWC